jgi:HSP20 family protein
MPISDILPWNRGSAKIPIKRNQIDLSKGFPEPASRTMDEFFNNAFRSIMAPLESFCPQVDVIENEKDLKVVAEIPGIDEKDIQVTLSDDILSISGFKETEKEEKGKRFHHIERISGSFKRDVPLPVQVDVDRVEAVFKNGVITITLPKIYLSLSKGKHIAIRRE